jgi:predicted AAA+ superfamily ATPase
MISRTFWLNRIIEAWKSRPIVWLSGVRRTFQEALYCNCDLPSMLSRIADPEFFYSSVQNGSMVVFDEVHRVPDPSLLLKIGADEFPYLKILATGSSTLAATRKFRDSLTGIHGHWPNS